MAAFGAGYLWVRTTRYRREELVKVQARQVVSPWGEYADELEARRQERMARRANRNFA